MPRRAPRTCPRHNIAYTSDRCPTCVARTTATVEAHRPTASDRGYGPKWRYIRAQYLAHHPTCALCGDPSEVPDHWPTSRAQLVAQGDPHPDAWHHLRPLCKPCHSRETNRNQPGGWNRR